MKKANKEIREKCKLSNVTFWQIADRIGCAESTFTRKMRHELPEDQKQEILSIINKLSEVEDNV